MVEVKKEGEEEEEGQGGQEEPALDGSQVDSKEIKENLSDLSEEEEIKVPPKDLTGNNTIGFLKYDI